MLPYEDSSSGSDRGRVDSVVRRSRSGHRHSADIPPSCPTWFCRLICPLSIFASAKCEPALLERLELATTVALQAGAAMKLVINMKNKSVIHKGVVDL